VSDNDWVLHNARIHTPVPAHPSATAVWIRDGRIRAVGDDRLLDEVSAARRIDLQGRCILPGLTDAHLHFEWFSLGLQRIDADQPTQQHVLDAIAHQAALTGSDEWIRGHGWNHNTWGDGRWPTRQQLDAAAPDHPVYLTAKSGHASWANSRALALAQVTTSTPDPTGGTIVRESCGAPSGVFLETASDLISSHLPPVSVTEVAAAMQQGMARAHALGITGVHDMDGVRALRAWQQLRSQGRLQLRVCKTIPVDHLDDAIGCGLTSGFGDDHLWIGGVKIFTDGALGPQTAWMLAPYEGDADNLGMPLIEVEDLRQVMTKAAEANLASFVHAIGDRANRVVLDVIEGLRQRQLGQQEIGRRVLRHRIEHVQVIDPSDIPRLASLDVIASMQPIHATSDREIVDRFWGPRRAPYAYAFHSIAAAGATLAFGSDTPVETIAPLSGLHAAVTRRRADGSPGDQGWQPQERLSVAAAIRGYTTGAARAAGVEDRLGRLAPGYHADLIVLDRDPHDVDSMSIRDLHVLATMVGGEWVYRHADAAHLPDAVTAD
jgi:predicted amidohydrolase YtcJ